MDFFIDAVMEATELRIGNVLKTEHERLVVVNFVNGNGISCFHENWWGCKGGWNKSDSYPVPITKDILYKLGFEKTDTSYLKAFLEFKFHPERTEEIICFAFGISFGHIECLHQLQNFYFSFTGEELSLTGLSIESTMFDV